MAGVLGCVQAGARATRCAALLPGAAVLGGQGLPLRGDAAAGGAWHPSGAAGQERWVAATEALKGGWPCQAV